MFVLYIIYVWIQCLENQELDDNHVREDVLMNNEKQRNEKTGTNMNISPLKPVCKGEICYNWFIKKHFYIWFRERKSKPFLFKQQQQQFCPQSVCTLIGQCSSSVYSRCFPLNPFYGFVPCSCTVN